MDHQYRRREACAKAVTGGKGSIAEGTPSTGVFLVRRNKIRRTVAFAESYHSEQGVPVCLKADA